MNIEALVLFIYETSLLKDIEYIDYNNKDYLIKYPFGPYVIDESFISQLNDFFEKTYKENKELLKIIFDDMTILDEFIKEKYDILDYKTLLKILSKYQGIKGYLSLVNKLNQDKGKKINDLSLSFLEYYNNILELYNEEYTGYKKILQ